VGENTHRAAGMEAGTFHCPMCHRQGAVLPRHTYTPMLQYPCEKGGIVPLCGDCVGKTCYSTMASKKKDKVSNMAKRQ